MNTPSQVISLSGGKDSTAMLLLMLERGENIADIVFFDTGWEFPQMYDHLHDLENLIGRKITRLHPRLPAHTLTEKHPFDYLFSEVPVRKRVTKEIRFYGRGWPHPQRRWCTGVKQDAIKAHVLGLTHRQSISTPLYQCIGFAADEEKRVHGRTKQSSTYITQRFPLIEWGVTEADALKLCHNYGFHWGGLYKHFSRVSCFCCPLQSLNELRKLRKYYPALWQRMLFMDAWLPAHDVGRCFRGVTLPALEERFYKEEFEQFFEELSAC